MLTAAQRGAFAERGVLHLPGALDERARVAMRAAVERALDGVSPPPGPTAPSTPARGGRAFERLWRNRIRSATRSGAFKPLLTGALVAAARELVDGQALAPLTNGRGQLLFTPPNAQAWSVPATIWHTDLPRLPHHPGPVGVQLFGLLEALQPGGGATLVVAGSHRLYADVPRAIRSRDLKKRLLAKPFFRELMSPGGDRARLARVTAIVDGVPVQVVELCGDAGDVWLTDPRLLHTLAPNARDAPRIVVTERLMLATVRDAIFADHPPPA